MNTWSNSCCDTDNTITQKLQEIESLGTFFIFLQTTFFPTTSLTEMFFLRRPKDHYDVGKMEQNVTE